MRKSVDHVNHLADGPATDVLEAVHALMHAVRARQHRAMREGGHALTPMEGKFLGLLARHPGATQSDLVAHTGRDKGQIARLVNGLRERGLVEATADAHDRRSQRLHLSEAARALHDAVHRERERLSAVAVLGLDADERQRLLGLLARVRENVDTGD
jgi:DNA-binding MarR family transcriptional regulator